MSLCCQTCVLLPKCKSYLADKKNYTYNYVDIVLILRKKCKIFDEEFINTHRTFYKRNLYSISEELRQLILVTYIS